jgi:hypothetical protein
MSLSLTLRAPALGLAESSSLFNPGPDYSSACVLSLLGSGSLSLYSLYSLPCDARALVLAAAPSGSDERRIHVY